MSALLICGSAFRSEALTNIVNNSTFDTGNGGWQHTGGLEVNLQGGYIVIGDTFYQDLNTVPGRDYVVQFAIKNSIPILRWGDEVYTTFTNTPAASTWQYYYCFVHATTNITRLLFQSQAVATSLNEVLAGSLLEPATIVMQPQSRSALDGRSVSFSVEADGGPVLYYQWFFNGDPIPGATGRTLIKNDVNASSQGDYFVIVSNSVNAVRSTVARLAVEPQPTAPVIVYRPETQEVPNGYWHTLRVGAIGKTPLEYQWFFNGEAIAGATKSSLIFGPINQTNAGVYTVRVANEAGSVLSLPATLNVYTLTNAVGAIQANMIQPTVQPIFDVDGYTRVRGSNFLAQLYAGPSPVILRPVGAPIGFGSTIGIFTGTVTVTREVPDVPPGELAYAQVRVWETAWGSSYEESRARGGKFGFSSVLSAPVSLYAQPATKIPFKSFTLRYGVPQFTTGRLESGGRLPDGSVQWILTGEPGFRYLIEKRLLPQNWVPLMVLTNDTGRVPFTDPDARNSSVNFYRSRILE